MEDNLYGEVLCVQRIGYKHFAVGIGNNRVIHYAFSGYGSKGRVKEASIDELLDGKTSFYVCDFPESHGKPSYIPHIPHLPIPRMGGIVVPIEWLASLSSLRPNNIFSPGFFTSPVAALSFVVLPLARMLYKKLMDDYHLYSKDETVERAKSKLGEERYNLMVNNCEHFAIWCKTNVAESYQIEFIINSMVYMPSVWVR